MGNFIKECDQSITEFKHEAYNCKGNEEIGFQTIKRRKSSFEQRRSIIKMPLIKVIASKLSSNSSEISKMAIVTII